MLTKWHLVARNDHLGHAHGLHGYLVAIVDLESQELVYLTYFFVGFGQPDVAVEMFGPEALRLPA
jgi:hypothetical protein